MDIIIKRQHLDLLKFTLTNLLYLIIITICTIIYSYNARAFNFNITPSLEVNEVYTDNVGLVDSGNKENDFISVITPALVITGEGRYSSTAIYYNLQNIFYADSGSDKHIHTLNIINNSELLQNLLHLDLDVKKSQQNVSNVGGRPSDSLSLSSDLQDVFSYKVSPYWQQQISNISDIEVRFSYDKIKSDTLTNQSKGIDVHIESGALFSNMLWETNYNYKDISGTAQNQKFNTVTGSLKYLINNRFAVLTDIGYDDNEFAATRNDVTGMLWNLGIEWKPSQRTSLKLKYGERYFGTNALAELSHETKRSSILISYKEIPDTERTRLLEQQAFELTDAFGAQIPDPSFNQPAILDVTGSDRFTEVFIRKTLRVAYTLNLPKNHFNLLLAKQNRVFQLSTADESTDSVSMYWIWDISRLLNSKFDFKWNNSEYSSGIKDEYYMARFNLSRTINKLLKINLGMNYSILNSNTTGRDYDEFRAFAGITKSF